MKAETKTEVPASTDQFSDDHETWRKALSILAGVREVLAEVRAQNEAIYRKHGGKPFAPGIGERLHLADALQETSRNLGVELNRIARSSGMIMPEGLR